MRSQPRIKIKIAKRQEVLGTRLMRSVLYCQKLSQEENFVVKFREIVKKHFSPVKIEKKEET